VLCAGAVLASAGYLFAGSGPHLNVGGWDQVRAFFAAAVRPTVMPVFLQLTLESILITVAFALCGLAISLVIGFFGGLLGSEVWHGDSPGPIRGMVRAVLSFPRAVHEVLWALFFVIVLGLDPLAAVLALGLPFGAITAKVFGEILDEVPRVSYLALRNAGAPRAQALAYGLLPFALPNLLSYTLYRFECALRASAVLGVVGAGGVGYQLLLSLQSLQYNQIWTLLYALFALSAVTDLWSAQLRRWLDAPTRLGLTGDAACAPGARRPMRQTRILRLLAAGFIVAIATAFWYVDADWSRLWSPRSAANLTRLATSVGRASVDTAGLVELGRLTLQTAAMSIVAIAIAGTGGVVLSYLAALHHGRDTVRRGLPGVLVSRGALLAMRAVPAPIWALLALFIMFPGPLPGALAIAVHNLGILGRLMAENVENMDARPAAALANAGVAPVQSFVYAVLPASVPQAVAYALYRWEVCTRETVIVGLVGAGGLGRLIQEQLSSFDYGGLLLSVGALFLLTALVDRASGWARRALR
jgi:phosphonate transport system permease protein